MQIIPKSEYKKITIPRPTNHVHRVTLAQLKAVQMATSVDKGYFVGKEGRRIVRRWFTCIGVKLRCTFILQI